MPNNFGNYMVVNMINFDLIGRLRGRAISSYCSNQDAELHGQCIDAITSLETEVAEVRKILTHTDMGSLPNDWTAKMVAEARIDDMIKLRDRVRDTCVRAEKAETALSIAKHDAVVDIASALEKVAPAELVALVEKLEAVFKTEQDGLEEFLTLLRKPQP